MKIVCIAASEQCLYALMDNGEIWLFRQGDWQKLEFPPLSRKRLR